MNYEEARQALEEEHVQGVGTSFALYSPKENIHRLLYVPFVAKLFYILRKQDLIIHPK